MNALEAFKQTNERAVKLVELHKSLNPIGKPHAEHSDILRAAVVISVSAMDAYFHTKITEKTARFVRAKKGVHLPGRLVQIIKDGASHDRLIEFMFKDKPLSHIASLVRKAIEDHTYQNSGKIEEGLKILGVDDLWFQIGKKLQISKDRAKKYVQGYVDRRHRIVHRGDLGTAMKNKNKLRNITRFYADQCVKSVGKYIWAIDSIVEAKVPQA